MDMLMLFIGGLQVLDKYGNSNDDDEDKDGSSNCISISGKGDIHLSKTIMEPEWMTALHFFSARNLKKSL